MRIAADAQLRELRQLADTLRTDKARRAPAALSPRHAPHMCRAGRQAKLELELQAARVDFESRQLELEREVAALSQDRDGELGRLRKCVTIDRAAMLLDAAPPLVGARRRAHAGWRMCGRRSRSRCDHGNIDLRAARR